MIMDTKNIQMPSHDDSKVITFGLGVIFVVFVLLGGWMGFAPLASSSVAIGQVSADLGKKTIQHLEGGKVTEILVKDGDKVKKGQLLIKLRDVQIQAQLDILRAQYQDTVALFARLQAQRDEKYFIDNPSELIDLDAIKDQKNIFAATIKSMADEKTIMKSRVIQITNQISGLKSLMNSKEIRIISLKEEISEWQDLYEQRLVDKQRLRELEREKNIVDGDLANTKSEISKLQEQISELKNQQLLRVKEFKNETLQRYVEAKSLVSDLKSKIIANEDILQRTNITSPIDGTVVGLTIHTVGAVISPANPVLEVIPNDAKLLVLAQVQTTDIDKVKVGLLSEVRFSAFNLQQAQSVEGKVIHVSADSFIDEATGAPYYKAKIELTKDGIESLKENKFFLLPGMPAEVMIQTGERTTLSYLIKPFADMLTRSFNEE